MRKRREEIRKKTIERVQARRKRKRKRVKEMIETEVEVVNARKDNDLTSELADNVNVCRGKKEVAAATNTEKKRNKRIKNVDPDRMRESTVKIITDVL